MATVTMQIIDPLNRTGKVPVPVSPDVVFQTLGMSEYFASNGQRDYSLCLLYQKGTCNLEDRCHQIHVRPDYVAQLRRQTSGPTCCLRHGEPRSLEQGYRARLASVGIQGMSLIVPGQEHPIIVTTDLLARTVALEGLLERRTYAFNTTSVCRLHQSERCRFGKDCKNIHICREFWCRLVERISSEPNVPFNKSLLENTPTKGPRPNKVASPANRPPPLEESVIAPDSPSDYGASPHVNDTHHYPSNPIPSMPQMYPSHPQSFPHIQPNTSTSYTNNPYSSYPPMTDYPRDYTMAPQSGPMSSPYANQPNNVYYYGRGNVPYAESPVTPVRSLKAFSHLWGNPTAALPSPLRSGIEHQKYKQHSQGQTPHQSPAHHSNNNNNHPTT